MNLRLFTSFAAALTLASCTSLSDFEQAYLRVKAGEANAIDAYDEGLSCHESISPLVAFPRLFGSSSYDNYLVRYSALTCAVNPGKYQELKARHFPSPTEREALVKELQHLQRVAGIGDDGRARISAELAQMGTHSQPAAATPATVSPPAAMPAPVAKPPVAKPTGKAAAKPTGKAAAKPTGKAAAKPTSKTAAKPTSKTAAKPTGKAAAKPTGKTTGKRAAGTQKRASESGTKTGTRERDTRPDWLKNW